MYYKHFGLTRPPFRITPDTDFFFSGGKRGAILEALVYSIAHGEGIVKVVGEVGSGKTMLCRMLQASVPDTIETVYLGNPSVAPVEILHAIAIELQLPLPRDAGRLEVMHVLNDYLLARHAQGKQVVLFVEESQCMPLATLEEIRLLSNLETSTHKLLQIVLFGQPELDQNLRTPQIRQLRERITQSFELSPLTADEVGEYLRFRLRAAGYRGPELFSKRVVDCIWRVSGGLTRRINIVADKALLAAYAADSFSITLKHIEAAVADIEFDVAKAHAHAWPIWSGVAATIAAGTALTIVLRLQLAPHVPAPLPSQSDPRIQTAIQSREHASQVRMPVAPSATSAFLTAHRSSILLGTQQATPQHSGSQTPAAIDLLEQRLLVSERWLAQQQHDLYSIQLLGSSDRHALKSYLELLRQYIEEDRIFVFRLGADRTPSMTVLFGSFPARAEAVKSMEALPSVLKTHRPRIRSVEGVRTELARHKAS